MRDYDVFARPDRHEPLRQVGTVSAADARDAVVFARSVYDERPWKEMLVVARDDIVRVVRPR